MISQMGDFDYYKCQPHWNFLIIVFNLMASPCCYMLFLFLHLLFLQLHHSCSTLLLNPNDASPLVTQVCQQSKYYEFCIKTLNSDPRAATADLKGIAHVSFEQSLSSANDTNAFIAQLLKNATDPGMKQGLDHCSINYGGSVYALQQSIKDLDDNDYNAMAKLSGIANENARDCERAFIEGPTHQSPLTSRNVVLVQLSDISDVITLLLVRSPDPVTGTRNRSYMEAVTVFLGRKQAWMCGLLQYVSFYGTGIAYVITTSNSVRAIQKSDCYHKEGHAAPCAYGNRIYMLLFGILQIVMSQISDFHNMEWLSIVAAIMSFSYSSIGLALGFAKVIGNGRIKGSIGGVPATSTAHKLFSSFQALGDIAFAYPYSIILLEIQDTLKSTPPENKIMKKASVTAVSFTTFFYLGCGCFGYAAFGNHTPGNILSGFGFYEPYWLVDFANACIILHLVGGYQMFSQPLFALVERWLMKKFPNSGCVTKFYSCKLPLLPAFQMSLPRLCFRTAYVVSTTGIALLFPFFNQVLGVIGALNFWPLAIYFPVETHLVQREIGAWTRKWIVLRAFSIVCLLFKKYS